MDINFQERIDEYLLHRDRMSAKEQADFLKEIEGNAEKKQQFEISKNIKDAFASRGNKLKTIAEFEKTLQRMDSMRATGSDSPMPMQNESIREESATKKGNKSIWLWISGIAAVAVIGVFLIKPWAVYEDIMDSNGAIMRGNGEIFENESIKHFESLDSLNADSVMHINDTLEYAK